MCSVFPAGRTACSSGAAGRDGRIYRRGDSRTSSAPTAPKRAILAPPSVAIVRPGYTLEEIRLFSFYYNSFESIFNTAVMLNCNCTFAFFSCLLPNTAHAAPVGRKKYDFSTKPRLTYIVCEGGALLLFGKIKTIMRINLSDDKFPLSSRSHKYSILPPQSIVRPRI